MHSRQLKRVRELVSNVDSQLQYNLRMAKILHWVCHTIALVSALSGTTIVGVSFDDTSYGTWTTRVLGVLSILYSGSKYFNIEGKRNHYQTMGRFCKNLYLRLEEVLDRMTTLIETGAITEEAELWSDLVMFINATSQVLQSIDIGVEDIQKELSAFQEFQRTLQKEGTLVPTFRIETMSP